MVQVGSLIGALQNMGVPSQQLGLLKTLLRHAGAEQRVGDLYSNRSFSSRFATMAKNSIRVRSSYCSHANILQVATNDMCGLFMR